LKVKTINDIVLMGETTLKTTHTKKKKGDV
jgi:hypothetical protein